jgi:hypothetical protein
VTSSLFSYLILLSHQQPQQGDAYHDLDQLKTHVTRKDQN